MRYILFGGDRCYPKGGAKDFLKGGDILDSLTDHIQALKLADFQGSEEHPGIDEKWFNIMDTDTGEYVEYWAMYNENGFIKGSLNA